MESAALESGTGRQVWERTEYYLGAVCSSGAEHDRRLPTSKVSCRFDTVFIRVLNGLQQSSEMGSAPAGCHFFHTRFPR